MEPIIVCSFEGIRAILPPLNGPNRRMAKQKSREASRSRHPHEFADPSISSDARNMASFVRRPTAAEAAKAIRQESAEDKNAIS
jgi:hypothetical protein